MIAMKILRTYLRIILSILFIAMLAVIYSCEVKHGLGPLPSIKGRAYIKGIRPEVAGEMIVVVAPDFPPKKVQS